MSLEPRSIPAPDPAAGNGTGRNNGGAANGHENGSATPNAVAAVLVATSAESALAAVERHLRQEAIEARLAAPAPQRSATPTIARSAPTDAPARTQAPVRIAPVPVPGDDRWADDDDADAEFWGETRPRRRRPLVDLDTIPDDERRSVGRLQARKVRRIIRHVSPWSVFKISVLFYLCVWLIMLIAGAILWRVGQEAGAISNIETFYAKATGEISFELDGRSVFRSTASAGLILVFAGTAFTVMLSVLFNLVTDLTGGVRLTVVELGDARRPVNTRRAGGRKLLKRVRGGASTATAEVGSGASPDTAASTPATAAASVPARR